MPLILKRLTVWLLEALLSTLLFGVLFGALSSPDLSTFASILGARRWCHIVFAWILRDDGAGWGRLEEPKTVAVPSNRSHTFRHPHAHRLLPFEAGLKFIRAIGGASVPRRRRVHCVRVCFWR